MTGRLTTHVLDTTHGRPAGGMEIELWLLDPTAEGGRTLLRTVRTNDDGRPVQPLLAGDDLKTGVYELVFAVGPYFADLGVANADVPFLDKVPVRFGIADRNVHYHIPLLASPWAYTTYRGS